MLEPLKLLKKSLTFFLKDKIALALALIPICIGLLLYGSTFYFFYDMVSGISGSWLSGLLNIDSFFFKAIMWLINGILAIIAYFLVNWTFVLFVSLLGSPLNDFISERVEKNLYGKPLKNLNQSFQHISSKVVFIVFNELKKISFILILSFLAFILGYIPFLTPLSLILAFLLVAVQFVDYTWARHDLKFRECVSDMRKYFLSYSFNGVIYFLLINIPVINLFVPALATAHFTYFFNERHLDITIGKN